MAKTSEKPDKVVHITREKSKPSASMTLPKTMSDMERMWDDLFSRGWMNPRQWEFPLLSEWSSPFERRMLPRIDLIDMEEEILLRAQIPGVEKKDLHVSMTDTTVSIEGSVQKEDNMEKSNYHRRECLWGTFTRSVALPCDVDSAKAKATFKDGVLELHLPKMTKSNRRSVAIE